MASVVLPGREVEASKAAAAVAQITADAAMLVELEVHGAALAIHDAAEAAAIRVAAETHDAAKLVNSR